MRARLFSLVSAKNKYSVFAWGMQVWHRDRTDAVIFRWDPLTGKTTTGTHASAESALAMWQRITPLELRWETSASDVLEMLTSVAPCEAGPLPAD